MSDLTELDYYIADAYGVMHENIQEFEFKQFSKCIKDAVAIHTNELELKVKHLAITLRKIRAAYPCTCRNSEVCLKCGIEKALKKVDM